MLECFFFYNFYVVEGNINWLNIYLLNVFVYGKISRNRIFVKKLKIISRIIEYWKIFFDINSVVLNLLIVKLNV